MRSYAAARGLFSFITLLSWVFMIGGGLGAVMGVAILGDIMRSQQSPVILLGSIPGILISIIGFFSLVMAQMGRASVDSTEYGQQMLQVARDQLEVSRQSLRKGDQAPTTYTSHQPVEDAPKSGGYATLGDRKETSTPAAEPDRTRITYKDRTIIATDGIYQLDGRSYPSLEAVHLHIDNLTSPPSIGRMDERGT